MWLFTKYGFYSATVSLQDRAKVQIRARVKDDLDNLITFFGDRFQAEALKVSPVIIETPRADYRFRWIVPQEVWVKLARELAADVDYSNFKNQIHDHERHNAYLSVWGIMARLQDASAQRAAYRRNQDALPGFGGFIEHYSGPVRDRWDEGFVEDEDEDDPMNDPFFVGEA